MVSLLSPAAWAYGESARYATPAYDLLNQKANAISTESHLTGWGYIVSGVAAIGLSTPAYYLSDDIFAKAIYSAGQTLGVAAVGYGSYLVLLENDYTRFKGILDATPELTAAQREKLARLFLIENAQRARAVRKIRVISHSLTAGLNFSSGLTASQTELRTAMFFLGGINVLAALSFGFSKSEEEKLASGLQASRPRQAAHAELFTAPAPTGAMLGMRLSFD